MLSTEGLNFNELIVLIYFFILVGIIAWKTIDFMGKL